MANKFFESVVLDEVPNIVPEAKNGSEGGLSEELFPDIKVAMFQTRTGELWEKVHLERGEEVAGFLHRLNEVHVAETLDIDIYLALLNEADSKIDSLVTPEYVSDPVTIRADPEYAYIWNNTHKNVAKSIRKKAEFLPNDKKNELNRRLLDYMKSHFGRYPWDIEFDRQRDIFWVMENTWTEQSADQISQFYSGSITEQTGIRDYSVWSLEYGRNETYGSRLQNLIIYSSMKVLDRNPTTEEEKEGFYRLVNSMMDDHIFGHLGRFVEVYEKLGPSYSIEPLLQNLRSENDTRRRISAEILYRLELGRIEVSDKGVNYLGKLYDLEKYNDPDFFVRRLNNSGLIGVLEESSGSIKGVFPLNLYSSEDVVKTEVHQLISQDLFLPKADEIEQQRQEREEYLKLFLENYESIFNDDFFKDTGVRINSLDLHEQGWFLLNYIELSKQGNEKKLERLKEFVEEYGELGLKSFLSLEYGGSGEDILNFVENKDISKEEKMLVFSNFYRISNEALNWRNIFQKVEAGLDYKFSAEAYEAFLRKNSEYLKAAQIISRGDGGDISLQELLSNMSSVANSLRVLNGFYNKEVGLKLDGKPSIHDEYSDNGQIIKEARKSWRFIDETGVVINLTIRNIKTREGEPRINFKITDPKTKVSTRIAFDLSYFGVGIGKNESPSVSLDLGVLDPRFEPVDYSTESVGRVLSVVKDSEGGHNESSFRLEASEYFEIIANYFVEYINRKFFQLGRFNF